MVASSGFTTHSHSSDHISASVPVPAAYQEEICDKLIQLSFAKIVNSKSERGGARLHKNLLILHLLQKARLEQRNRLLLGSSPMDTTMRNRVVQYQPIPHSNEDMNLRNKDEQMQTDSLMEDEDVGEEEENEIEIDETFSQHEPTSKDSENITGTISTLSYYNHTVDDSYDHNDTDDQEHSKSSTTACLSGMSQGVVSDFDGSLEESRQQASSGQATIEATEIGHFSINAKTSDDGDEEKLHSFNENCDRPRRQKSHRRYRSRSGSTKILNRNGIRNSSTSSSESSSSSEDSDESCSSEENYLIANTDGNERKKSRDCLKRKLSDETSVSTASSTSNSISDSTSWYSSPKIACIVHHTTTIASGSVSLISSESTTQNQNLNGLITVFQSAALTSDDSSKIIKHHDQENSEFQIFETETNSETLTRSLSCPGLMELACES